MDAGRRSLVAFVDGALDEVTGNWIYARQLITSLDRRAALF
jgi:hypothetical protein